MDGLIRDADGDGLEDWLLSAIRAQDRRKLMRCLLVYVFNEFGISGHQLVPAANDGHFDDGYSLAESEERLRRRGGMTMMHGKAGNKAQPPPRVRCLRVQIMASVAKIALAAFLGIILSE